MIPNFNFLVIIFNANFIPWFGKLSIFVLLISWDFVSPNVKRAERKRGKGKMYEDRKRAQESRKIRNENIVVPADPLDSVFR